MLSCSSFLGFGERGLSSRLPQNGKAAPDGHFVLDNLHITPPGVAKPIIKGLSFDLPKGSQLAIIRAWKRAGAS